MHDKMDGQSQYYYKLMASYLSKRNCDESFVRYFLGKSAKRTPEELERADERKRRLQRERSRRYRALKNARRHRAPDRSGGGGARPAPDDESSDPDEPPTLCDLSYDDKWRESAPGGPDAASDDNSAASGDAPPRGLRELLAEPDAELDYPTVHSLMFHWLQT